MDNLQCDTQDLQDLYKSIPVSQYIIQKKLDQGTFGSVYLAYDNLRHQSVAIQIEKEAQIPQYQSSFSNEVTALQILQEIEGIPKLQSYQMSTEYRYIVMNRVGKDFSHIFKRMNRQFSTKNIILLALKLLNLVEKVHQKQLLHRDIKPENIAIGLGKDRDQIFLVDFGSSINLNDVELKTNRNFVGTIRYASRAMHRGDLIGKKDDLESIFYVLLYFSSGKLPWQNLKEDGDFDQTKIEQIGQLKCSIPPDELCSGLPSFYFYYLTYINKLSYKDEPDYQYIRSLFQDCALGGMQISSDQSFDWEVSSSSTNTSFNSMDQSIDNSRANTKIGSQRINNLNLVKQVDEKLQNDPLSDKRMMIQRNQPKQINTFTKQKTSTTYPSPDLCSDLDTIRFKLTDTPSQSKKNNDEKLYI